MVTGGNTASIVDGVGRGDGGQGMRIVGMCLCVVVAGCSFSLDGPPANYQPHRHGPPTCDRESGGLAVLDGLGIAIAMIPVAVVASKSIAPKDHGGSSFEDDAPWLVGGMALSALGALALAHGSCATARCEKAHLDFARWMSDTARRRPHAPIPRGP